MTSIQLDFLQAEKQKLMSPSLKEAIKTLRDGLPILLLDDNDRENEGDLVIAAEKIDSESMNFLIKKGSGVVCLAISQEKRQQLELPMMVPDNTNTFQTGFTVSIEALSGVSTGVSAQDRAHTIRVAMADEAKPSDLRRPGHVFPLAARKRGVFERMGHTEGSIDLMKIANLKPGAVLCELMNPDGTMAIGEQRLAFAREHSIPMLTVEDILFYRIRTEDIIEECSTKKLETRFGPLSWHCFNFLGQTKVNILMSEKCLNEPTHRLCLVPFTNLNNRFITQILGNHDDDPLCEALSQLEQGKIDIIALIAEPNDERRSTAYLCRSLVELSVKKLSLEHDVLGFSTIAKQQFDLQIYRHLP